jgi:septum formation protein
MKTPSLILASQSPRRKILLRQIGLKFVVAPSVADEKIDVSESPSKNVRRIALGKAQIVARRYRRGIVVGADTIVVIQGRILEKPRSRGDAKRMLRLLSGSTHRVYTGLALVDAASGRRITRSVRTTVRFRKLEEEEIDAYVATGAPMDKAGAYGIQDDYGAVFVEKVNGCFYNVVGFPLSTFFVMYRGFMKNRLRD